MIIAMALVVDEDWVLATKFCREFVQFQTTK